MSEMRYFIPFDATDTDWRLFFPVGTVWHRGKRIKFTKTDASELVSNFKKKVPDYDLPINMLHKDEHGVFGYVGDLRVGDTGNVEWKPEFRDEKAEEIKSKGYKYASPEIQFRQYQALDGKTHNNVAVGVALTPRPRLGRQAAVFSDGEWVVEDDPAEEETMSLDFSEQLKAFVAPIAFGLAELKVKFDELATAVTAEPEPAPEPEAEPIVEPEPVVEPVVEPEATPVVEKEPTEDEEEDEEMSKELEAKVDEQAAELEDKVTEITTLSEQLAEAQAQLETHTAKLAEAEHAERLRQFSDELSEIETLPVEVEKVAPLMLEFADKVGEAEYKDLLAIMKAMGNAAEVGALSEVGSDSTNNDATSRFDAAVRKHAEESGKSYADAIEVVAVQEPELYAEYDKATTKAMRQMQEVE